MSVFDSLATGYDLGMLPLELAVLRRLRRRAFAPLTGRVLELGAGTGANLPLYGPQAKVVALDRSGPMLEQAARRRTRAVVRLLQADVHCLPFGDGLFDAVAGALLFCSVTDPARALAEVRRVLTSGGRLVLVEHTRGKGVAGWLTDTFDPPWHAFSRECHLNRETTRAVTEAGFLLEQVEERLLGVFRLIAGRKE